MIGILYQFEGGMDKIDAKIVQALQEDGRLTNQDLAEKIGLSPSPCLRRVRNLEKAGIIKAYSATIDQKACGYPITCFVRIRLSIHTEDTIQKFEKIVEETPEILDCYLMAGGSDYQLRVVTGSLDEYEQLVRQTFQKLPGISSVETSFAYGVVKKSRVLPVKINT